MKTNLKKIFSIISIMLCFALFVCAICFFAGNSNKKVFAESATIYDKQTEILDDDSIISSSLWNALRQFYNNNKTDEMPAIKTNSNNLQYLTTDLFENFPISKLNLSGKEIDDITNLSIFDLSSFNEIDLSNNEIEKLNKELSKIDNLIELNVSNNNLKWFNCDEISSSSLNSLTKLNLSHNEISNCDISLFENAEIDVSHNNIEKENLELPNNLDLKVNLSYNYILSPNTLNTNISFGLQGIKNSQKYVIGQAIEYYGIGEVTSLNIYFQTKTVVNETEQIDETLIKTLGINETYTFDIGYYRIEFVAEEKTSETQDIEVYIYPKSPTVKMFRNGEELKQLEYTFSSPTTIKFYGDENATFEYKINNDESATGDHVEINKEGLNIVIVYQIIDGYYSDPITIFIQYKQRTLKGWIFVIAGSAVFIVAFYFIIKYYPILIKKHLGKTKDTGKKNLD